MNKLLLELFQLLVDSDSWWPKVFVATMFFLIFLRFVLNSIDKILNSIKSIIESFYNLLSSWKGAPDRKKPELKSAETVPDKPEVAHEVEPIQDDVEPIKNYRFKSRFTNQLLSFATLFFALSGSLGLIGQYFVSNQSETIDSLKLREHTTKLQTGSLIKPRSSLKEKEINEAILLEQLENYKEAEKKGQDIAKSAAERGDNKLVARSLFSRGKLLARQKKYKDSIIACELAVRLKPDYAEAYSCLGKAKIHLKQNDAAIIYFDEAIRLKPNYAEVYYDRGVVKAGLGQYNDAGKDFEKARDLARKAAKKERELGRKSYYKEIAKWAEQQLKRLSKLKATLRRIK